MNPTNVMASAAPRKLMQDVMPPYAEALSRPQASAPVAVASATPNSELQALPVQVNSPAAEPATVPVEAPKPMFPVETEAQVPAQEPTAPEAPVSAEAQTPETLVSEQKNVPTYHRINWVAIVAAVAVAALLLGAALIAFRSSS